MTKQPTSVTAPEEDAHPTHAWTDTLLLMGSVVLLAIVGLVVCISVAALFH